MNESYVMDGWKDNDVISIALKCLLLWPISIVSGAFERTGRGTKGGAGEGGRRAEMSWSYGMDGYKDNEMISAGW